MRASWYQYNLKIHCLEILVVAATNTYPLLKRLGRDWLCLPIDQSQLERDFLYIPIERTQVTTRAELPMSLEKHQL